jgi:hypothetical protein
LPQCPQDTRPRAALRFSTNVQDEPFIDKRPSA